MFMLPGGKPEGGESPAETALREFHEELRVVLNPALLVAIGEFRSPAANEPGHEVVAHVFEHPYVEGVEVSAEIDALEWVDPASVDSSERDDLAPLNTEHVFPRLRAR